MTTQRRSRLFPARALVLLALLACGKFVDRATPQTVSEPARDAGRWYQEKTGELPATGRLVVRSLGDVSIVGTETRAIRYIAKLAIRTRNEDAGVVPVMFERVGIESDREPDGTARIVLRGPDCPGCRFAALLEIQVPEDIPEINLQTVRGDIDVRGVTGAVTAQAAGGSVRMDEIGSNVSATSGGRIVLGAIGGSVACETAGGGIDLEHTGGSARLATRVGSVRAKSVGGDLEARTRAGSIEIGRVAGSVSVETSSGSIRVAEAPNGVRAQVGAGDIRIDRASGALQITSGAGNIAVGLGDRAGLDDSVLTTGVGSVVISLPETLALTVEAAVRMGRGRQSIVSEFPSIRVRRSPGPFGTAEAAGSINGGGAILRSGTGIGRIEIRRQR